MSCDPYVALRRLVLLYLQGLIDEIDYARPVDRHGCDEHRATELIRQWLRERPASSQHEGAAVTRRTEAAMGRKPNGNGHGRTIGYARCSTQGQDLGAQLERSSTTARQ
jgi:hypothetical protein